MALINPILYIQALAMGADGVGIGELYMYGLARYERSIGID